MFHSTTFLQKNNNVFEQKHLHLFMEYWWSTFCLNVVGKKLISHDHILVNFFFRAPIYMYIMIQKKNLCQQFFPGHIIE